MRFLVLAMLLSACATTRGAGVTGNEVSVTISNVWNRSAAFNLADEHCHKFGKAARPSTSEPDTYHFSFDCVAP